MTYYILLPNDTEQDTAYSTNTLGEASFGYFYAEQGMNALHNIITNYPEMAIQIKIKTDKNKTLTVAEFFDEIRDLKIRKM